MARSNRKKKADPAVQAVLDVLEEYKKNHSRAEIQVYRYSSVSIRIRIIDPDFQGIAWVDRDTEVWKYLDQLPDEVVTEITLLILLTPKEAKTSFANMEFENPVPL